MTDNRTDALKVTHTDNANQNSKPGDKVTSPMNKSGQDSNSSNTNTKPAAPQIKKLDIVIAGANYTIFCPTDEETELRAAETYLNNFVTNIKKDAPKLNQENLLVLSCLNLYEQINAHKTSETERQQQSKQNEQLLNKVMQEAHSVL